MPIAMLRFKLPEENEEFEQANRAGDFATAIWEIKEMLRQKIKYVDDQNTTWSAVREDIFLILEEKDVLRF